MPWKASDAVALRQEFVELAMQADANIARLCRRFGVSRQTGYKWIGRFRDDAGEAALLDRSRRPQRSPARTDEAIEEQVAALRAAHPAWGPRKLRRVLLDRAILDERTAPSPSTIGQILLRRGLIDAQASSQHRPFVRFERAHPNELWQMDFKGHFALLEGGRCHALTVLDDHSRYALALRACGDERSATVTKTLITLFQRYGQPQRILCDNGSPWGSSGLEPYTALSVWLILHGIAVSHGRTNGTSANRELDPRYRRGNRSVRRSRCGLPARLACALSTEPESWLWHSFRDLVRRVGCGVVAASVVMCAVRS
jgi:transposase InsO family protein